MALATIGTIGSPLAEGNLDGITSLVVQIGDPELVLEAAGVVFAFNTINRIADARRVPLEYRFLRELKPLRGWVERRLVSLTTLAYDLSFKHDPRHSPAELQSRLRAVFERLGSPTVPDVFHSLSCSPVVLAGVLEMIDSNLASASVHPDLLKEAAAIGVASHAMPGSGLRKLVNQWLPQEAFRPGNPSRIASGSDLESACRRYAWQVANAAYTVSEEQIRQLATLGLSGAEVLDLTLATAAFSSLAIIEPIGRAVVPSLVSTEKKTLESPRTHEVQVQLAE